MDRIDVRRTLLWWLWIPAENMPRAKPIFTRSQIAYRALVDSCRWNCRRSFIIAKAELCNGRRVIQAESSRAISSLILKRFKHAAPQTHKQDLGEMQFCYNGNVFEDHLYKVAAIKRQMISLTNGFHSNLDDGLNVVTRAVEYCNAGQDVSKMKIVDKSPSSSTNQFTVVVINDLPRLDWFSKFVHFETITPTIKHCNRLWHYFDDICDQFFSQQNSFSLPDFTKRSVKCKQWLHFEALKTLKVVIEKDPIRKRCTVSPMQLEKYSLSLLKLLQLCCEGECKEHVEINIEQKTDIEQQRDISNGDVKVLDTTIDREMESVNDIRREQIVRAVSNEHGEEVKEFKINECSKILDSEHLMHVISSEHNKADKALKANECSNNLESKDVPVCCTETKVQLKISDTSQMEVSQEISRTEVESQDYFVSKNNNKDFAFDHCKDCNVYVRQIIVGNDSSIGDLNVTLTVAPATNHANEHRVTQFEPLMTVINTIADGRMPPPHETMRYEMLRLCTFRTYPKGDKPFVIRFAQAGFYYAARGDEVICYCCACRKCEWTGNDIPMDIHKQISPNCSFLVRNCEVNVPMSQSKEDRRLVCTTEPEPVAQTHSPSLGSVKLTAKDLHQTAAENICSLVTNADFQRAKLTKETNIIHDMSDKFGSPGCAQERSNSNLRLQALVDQGNVTRNVTRQQAVVDNKLQTGKDFLRPSMFAHQQLTNRDSDSMQRDRGSVPNIDRDGASGHNRDIFSRPPETLSMPTPPPCESIHLPKHPKFETQVARLGSFKDCTVTIAITIESLVDAGFFYAGFGDCVRCFYCGIGLRNWTVEDDPWIEHARWSKECAYVKQCNGQEFINLVQLAAQYTADHKDETSNDESVIHKKRQANQLKKENLQLKEQCICKVCKKNDVCIVFLPCGHLVTCETCAQTLRRCPVCQAFIKGTVRTYHV